MLDGLADLTGGVAESVPLKLDPTQSGRLLLELLDMTSVVTAAVQLDTQQAGAKEKQKAAGFRIRGPEMAYTGGGQFEIPQTKGRAYCRAARLP